jgi:hypothetical protein
MNGERQRGTMEKGHTKKYEKWADDGSRVHHESV